MIIKVNFNLGENTYQLTVDDKDEMEALHKSIVLSNPHRFCNLCQNKNSFYLASNKDKEGNIYVNNKCGNCGADSKLGQYKAKGYFWHDFKKYIPKGRSSEENEKVEGCPHDNVTTLVSGKKTKHPERKFKKCEDCGKFLGWADKKDKASQEEVPEHHY
jgi:hypothetical protein|tara:strand:+ start:14121 stop:14597 length:477 start_codon:yes stop_codon:yes gene_type:complete